MIEAFTKFANLVSRLTGRPLTFIGCVVIVLVWAACGPIFKFSDTWQLIINTGTTIITFLMVFLIQNTQNRDNAALQAKLDEIIRAMPKADNSFIGIEHLTDEELERILDECEKTVEARRREPKLGVKPAAGNSRLAGTRKRKTAASG